MNIAQFALYTLVGSLDLERHSRRARLLALDPCGIPTCFSTKWRNTTGYTLTWGGYALLLLCIIFIAWKAFSKKKKNQDPIK